jgi:hypothetical protein
VPQFDVSLVVSTQAAPHVVLSPQATAHAPFWQTWLAAQALPHAPQFCGSELWLTHAPEHAA